MGLCLISVANGASNIQDSDPANSLRVSQHQGICLRNILAPPIFLMVQFILGYRHELKFHYDVTPAHLTSRDAI
jgi:hypothetical protein